MNERVQIAQKTAEDFMSFCNGANREQMEEFARIVTSEHRTIQQSAFCTMMKCVENWAENEHNGRYDARNEMTVKSSKQIAIKLDIDANPDAPLFADGKLLGLPYI